MRPWNVESFDFGTFGRIRRLDFGWHVFMFWKDFFRRRRPNFRNALFIRFWQTRGPEIGWNMLKTWFLDLSENRRLDFGWHVLMFCKDSFGAGGPPFRNASKFIHFWQIWGPEIGWNRSKTWFLDFSGILPVGFWVIRPYVLKGFWSTPAAFPLEMFQSSSIFDKSEGLK